MFRIAFIVAVVVGLCAALGSCLHDLNSVRNGIKSRAASAVLA